MANLSKLQVSGIIKNAPEGTSPEGIIRELINSGHTLEGYNPTKQGPAPEPQMSTMGAALQAGKETLQEDVPYLGKVAQAIRSDIPGAIAEKAGAAGFPKLGAAAGTAIGTAGEMIPKTGLDLATLGASMAAGPAIKGIGKVANPVAKKALGFMAEKFGGLSGEVTQMLENNAPNVIKYARMGVEGASEAAANAGKLVKSHIDAYAEKAGEAYRNGIEKIVGSAPELSNVRINLANESKAVDAVRKEFGFPETKAIGSTSSPVSYAGEPVAVPAAEQTSPVIARVGKSAPEKKLFNEFATQFKNGLTPEQAYYLQKDLSYSIRANSDKPIAAALGKLKKIAVNAFDASVEGTPLSTINKNYRAAMELSEDLSKISNADNAASAINSAFKNRSSTRDAINQISSISPEIQQSLDELFAATAGKQAAHWTAQLPPTGAKALYQATGLGTVAMAGHNPVVGIPAAAAFAAGTSPRMYGEGFNLLSKSLPEFPGATKALPSAALAALRARRKKE